MSSEIRGHFEFNKALKTLLARSRRKRLARMSYFIKSKSFREKDDVWRHADKLLEIVKNGKLTSASVVQLKASKPKSKRTFVDYDL